MHKILLKKLVMENADWTNHWSSIEGAGRTYTALTGYFYDKTKSLRKIFQRLLFTAKMLQETMHLAFPYLDQITYY